MIRIDSLVSILEGIRWKKYAADIVLIVVFIALAPLFMSRAPSAPQGEPQKIPKPDAAPEETVRPVDMAAVEARNVFSSEGRYREDPQKEKAKALLKAPPPPPPPPRNYKLVKLVGILKKEGQRRAVLREGAGGVVVLKTGDAFSDDTVAELTDNSVVLKNYCEERTLRMFDVSLKKP